MGVRLFILLFCLLGGYSDDIYYQSDALKNLDAKPLGCEHSIMDDTHEEVEIIGLQDTQGILYWYRRIKTPVCLTGECKLIDIGIYWDCTGSFLGLEVYGEHLTKTDHSDFSQGDYDHLMAILQNDWSLLREYELSELVEDPYEEEEVDGATGATKQEIASEAVADAVYTTHTIWHLIHRGEKEQLLTLTLEELKNNPGLVGNLLRSEKKEYRYFLLDLVGLGKLPPSPQTDSLVIDGLTASDSYLKKLATEALTRSNVDQSSMQSELAAIYRKASVNDKLPILSALSNLTMLEPDLYHALESDLGRENEWYAMKIIQVLQHSPDHSEKVLSAAQELLKSENALVRQTATEFLKQRQ